MTNEDTKPPAKGIVRLLGYAALFVLATLLSIVLALVWTFGTTTHHADRDDILMSDRGRSLIPPTAREIRLQRDFLDHRALYTISEAELNAFLDKRFRSGREPLDSYSERSPFGRSAVGKEIGPLGWTVTEHAVSYSYFIPNGAVSNFYHDPKTGLTYQESAYW
jgi:hypothetical protein